MWLGIRKTYHAAFKAKVALEVVKGEKTINQIASEYGACHNQIWLWWYHLLAVLPELFSHRQPREEKARDELSRQIVQLKVELEWLKKNRKISCRAEGGRSRT
ncbi:MAG: transposase [Candidatus Saccharicenans sp.]|uniref:transposase n=1 Tax=Candidatus Saccharicenans sp. TaxID=2819258 RepID=UPI00404A117F